MNTASQKKESFTLTTHAASRRPLSIKHKPRPVRSYFDVGIGSVCLSGEDAGGVYCLLEASLAPGIDVPRHTHAREDESYFVLVGELEVIVGAKPSSLNQATVSWPRATFPTSCVILGRSKIIISSSSGPSGFEGFLEATAVAAPHNAIAPTEPPPAAVRNVHELAAEYGILFG